MQEIASKDLRLEIGQFKRVFPFFVAFDRDLNIVDCGPSFLKLLAGNPIGQCFSDVLSISHPISAKYTYESLNAHHEKLFIFELNSGAKYRGQIVPSHDAEHISFLLGAPWFVDSKELSRCGMKLSDFALHDSVGDLLNVIQAQNMALRETEQLAEMLRAKRKEVERALHLAEAANRAKMGFLANMSHELKTPMNAILGFTQLMQMDPDTKDKHGDTLKSVRHSGAYLLGLLDDLLEMSKIEAEAIELQIEPVDVSNLLCDTIKMLQHRAEEKGIDLLLSIDPACPSSVRGDKRKLRQILLNLVANGIKFTEHGSVTLSISAHDEDQIEFKVADTGIGIAPEHLEHVFQPFERGGLERHSFEGAGLGLAICQRFVSLMSGAVTVDSVVGSGTTFSVTLPLPRLSEDSLEYFIPVIEGTEHAEIQPGAIEELDSGGESTLAEEVVGANIGDQWLDDFRNALENLEVGQVEPLLAEIEDSMPKVHATMRRMAHEFRYQEMVELLDTLYA